MPESLHLSVIVPVKNEEENVLPMLEEIQKVSSTWPWNWELIYVDDGSSDRTWEVIREARARDSRVRAVRFLFNCGQTSAVSAGVRHARGKICVTLDGDCQNDPGDIEGMVRAMGDSGNKIDMVMGWRRKRSDTLWRKIQSRIANGVRNRLTGETVHDVGCAIKAFDREKMLKVSLFEGMHRFLPTLFRYHGWKVIESEVNHRSRTRGTTKYGMWNRVFRALRDLFAVRWMKDRLIRYQLKDEDTID